MYGQIENESDVLAEELNERLQKKDRMRTLRIWLIGALIVLAILAALSFLLMKIFFSVKEVSLRGDVEGYAIEEILEASGIEKGDLMLFLDKKKAANGILERFVMIEEATIDRQAPDRVVITIKNETPCFYFKNESPIISGKTEYAYAVVSKSQKVLRIFDTEEEMVETYGVLPCVKMPDLLYAAEGKRITFKDEGDSDYIPQMLEMIEDSVFSSDTLFLDARIRFDIVLYSGVASDGLSKYEVRFGNKKKMKDKIAFAQSIAEKLDESFAGVISVGSNGTDEVRDGYARPRTL